MNTAIVNNTFNEHPVASNVRPTAGRVALVAVNVAAAVAPLIGAMYDPSTALEAILDSSGHVLRAATLMLGGPAWGADIIDGFRLFSLVGGFSQFPNPIMTGDLVLHTVNLISGRVL